MLTPSTSRAACNRVSLGGISLLLVVAFALQASAGVIEHGRLADRAGECTSARQIAETQSRPKLRVTRRQEHRPLIRSVGPVQTPGARISGPITRTDCGAPPARRQPARETDLPPPARV